MPACKDRAVIWLLHLTYPGRPVGFEDANNLHGTEGFTHRESRGLGGPSQCVRKKPIVERLGELLQSNAFSIAKDLLKADTVDLGEHVVSLAIERRIQGFVRCAA